MRGLIGTYHTFKIFAAYVEFEIEASPNINVHVIFHYKSPVILKVKLASEYEQLEHSRVSSSNAWDMSTPTKCLRKQFVEISCQKYACKNEPVSIPMNSKDASDQCDRFISANESDFFIIISYLLENIAKRNGALNLNEKVAFPEP